MLLNETITMIVGRMSHPDQDPQVFTVFAIFYCASPSVKCSKGRLAVDVLDLPSIFIISGGKYCDICKSLSNSLGTTKIIYQFSFNVTSSQLHCLFVHLQINSCVFHVIDKLLYFVLFCFKRTPLVQSFKY